MLARTALVLVMVIALAVVLWRHRTHDHPAPVESTGSAGSSGEAPSAAPAPAHSGPTHEMRTITAEQRAEIAEQIAKARAARAERKPSEPTATPAASGSATPPDPNGDYAAYADSYAVGLGDALQTMIPTLGKCIHDLGSDAGNHRNAAVQITLTGDPDVGTLINTDSIADGTGQPVTRELDNCVRTALDAVELPPVKEGATLQTQFTFDMDR